MKESGIIKKIENGTAFVEVMPPEACSKCCSCGAAKKRTVTISGGKIEGLNVGDHVVVEVPNSYMIKIYALMYILPLSGFLAGVFGGYLITNSPIISMTAGLLLTIVMFFIAGRITSRKKEFIPDVCPEK